MNQRERPQPARATVETVAPARNGGWRLQPSTNTVVRLGAGLRVNEAGRYALGLSHRAIGSQPSVPCHYSFQMRNE